ncbi:transaldolase [Acidiferrimicrobium sp. IK]|uniref:transaldolase n=1 Tax=Acidiferrimicrobium sp. IK TaxID=2871700 RepID=UPI0021CAF0F1|nr:transaldolase [Acidiferrimicrobium sp. IK]MCU4184643.1 transaldolase [Acidiferrimicrobium sp. IK]
MSETNLQRLYNEQGQSAWIDNLNRPSVLGGGLAELVASGIRGVTSNPTIFEKAMTGSDAYDDQFKDLVGKGPVDDAFWTMAVDDVTGACGVLRPVYDDSDGADGFVSLEVAPALATNTEGTISAARDLHQRIDLPNLMVKIPATAEGVPAIKAMIAEGRNINVTLIFSLPRYGDVMEAYIAGLEEFDAAGGDLSKVHSVASFFVSRVDTEVDRRLEAIGTDEAVALRGKAAVAQARRAYALFKEHFSGPRWEALAAKGANPQRPLWASTSTKNKAYPDLLYVDSLIGPHTVNTMPDATVEAFLDHGTVARTVDSDPDGAQAHLDALASAGVDLADVAKTLEDEGVASFSKSFDELIQSLTDKATALASGK